ncbi:hypothetical protein SAMD00019534_082880 [Acytostelium subglobosum LB1]|uniref:hypothetical protein n=1 Tax=Acytostelium subglobosum LB1 TaxID=1410327 RepID=UPI0006450816|nr:hypothetical protein SAMD00019534_082880 [Acytostelium subglobosum LB1]GAM25113.1 hypothetical protein SAMD00019534_082880 [Acytostelium subglobosum LB1]|eukprot:XP_012752202.1 hypothetical protein SAMD00019534_082880 [Acytostelium subglobosum LB1]
MTTPAVVHRCRFSSWRPSAITAIATNDDGTLAAIGRDDSTIEIWSIGSKHYIHTATLGGIKFDGKVIKLMFTTVQNTPRLVSMTEDHIYLWDYDTMTQVQSLSSFGGDMVDGAISHDGQVIAVASSSLVVHLYRFNDDGRIEFSRSFQRVTEGTLRCVAWGLDDKILTVGTDTDLIVYELATMSVRFSAHSSNITAICVVSKDAVACGHESGLVTIHDLQFGSLLHEFRQLISAVRSIVIRGKKKFFASGDDPSIVMFVKDDDRWVFNGLHRGHTHDVFALSVANKGLLLSGGLDTQLRFTNIRNFEKMNGGKGVFQRSYPPARLFSIASSAERTLIVDAARSSINVWALGKTGDQGSLAQLPAGSHLPCDEEARRLIQFDIKDKEFIRQVAISVDGQYMAYCTTQNTKLYQLKVDSADLTKVSMHRLKTLEGADCIQFTTDSTQLILASNSSITCYNIQSNTPKYIKEIQSTKRKESPTSILMMTVESSGKYVALVDARNNTLLFDAINEKFVITIPSSNDPISALAFQPDSAKLTIATTTSIIRYDAAELKNIGQFEVPYAFGSADPIIQITPSPTDPLKTMVMWTHTDHTYVCSWRNGHKDIESKKRIDDVYAVGLTQSKELVVCELPYMEQVFPVLPPAIRLRIFGNN